MISIEPPIRTFYEPINNGGAGGLGGGRREPISNRTSKKASRGTQDLG